jgi:integrase
MEITYQDTHLYKQYLDSIKDAYSNQNDQFTTFANSSQYGFTTKVLREYFTWLMNQGYKANTVNIKRACAINRLRKLSMLPGATIESRMQFEYDQKVISEEIKRITINKHSVGSEKIINASEYDATITQCHSEKQKCFVRFLYATGCRVSEMCGIRKKHCNNILGTVYITVIGKGNKERIVRVQEALFNEIDKTFNGQTYLFETSGGKPYLRTYVSDQVKLVTKRATGRGLSAHKMRHSWATRMMAQGYDPTAITQYMGNVDVGGTISCYSHNEITDDQLFND